MREDQAVGREGERFGWVAWKEPIDAVEIVGRLGLAGDTCAVEPDSHGEGRRVVEVGVDGADVADFDVDAGFLLELAAGGVADVLAPLDITAGDAPLTDVAAGGPSAKEDAAGVVKEDHRYADGGIAEVDEAAGCATGPGQAAANYGFQRLGAAGAEAVVGGDGLGHQGENPACNHVRRR